ncbi:putative sugar kinase YdjH [bioreactor metagenome]|uniref:Putative sugar kinase YdjH n=1 Tax=bioreactor metagenome TaxID=1076179 RepID=A0A644WEV1_9ZZZZ|nr:adenosine kinase [Paludibacter sp.]
MIKKILGMGNALTDILLQIQNDDLLKKLNLLKGGMQLINSEKVTEIQGNFNLSEAKMATGGSASNTVNGITRLGGKAGFFGKIGRDEIGAFFMQDTLHNGVVPHLSYSEQKSGTCTVLVSGDGERTLCTFLGAACELEPADLKPEMFIGYDIFHIEGYLVQNHDLIHTAIRMAKEAGLLVSIDLASYNVVEANLEFLKSIVSDYVDVVFANEEEAKAFTGKEPEEALIHIAEHAYIAVVKIGKDGSFVRSGDAQHTIKPYLADCIDTTGAGDLYAAGFLYGMARGLTLDKCGLIGSFVSSQVVEVLGAKMDDHTWQNINQQVEKIVAGLEY